MVVVFGKKYQPRRLVTDQLKLLGFYRSSIGSSLITNWGTLTQYHSHTYREIWRWHYRICILNSMILPDQMARMTPTKNTEFLAWSLAWGDQTGMIKGHCASCSYCFRHPIQQRWGAKEFFVNNEKSIRMIVWDKAIILILFSPSLVSSVIFFLFSVIFLVSVDGLWPQKWN